MLSAVHCGEVWREDFRAQVERAAEVETLRDETMWVSFRRYSSFKKKVEPLEGVVVALSTRGLSKSFCP